MAGNATDKPIDRPVSEPTEGLTETARSLPVRREDQDSVQGPPTSGNGPEPTAHSEPPAAQGLWLRRADQGALALLVALGLLGTVAWWWAHGGWRGELIEVERLESQRAEFLVDVNRADWAELTQLPGIGETLARRIVECRGREGPYARCEDLRRVKGIGPKTVERLRPYLAFSRDENAPSER